MSEDEGRVSARLDEVEAHGRLAENVEPTDEAEEDEVEAHSGRRLDQPRLDQPRVD